MLIGCGVGVGVKVMVGVWVGTGVWVAVRVGVVDGTGWVVISTGSGWFVLETGALVKAAQPDAPNTMANTNIQWNNFNE